MSFTAADLPGLTGRTAIVTGANRGIGLATARALAGAGMRVVLAVRDTGKGRAAARTIRGETEVRELDLADLASVRAFAAGWREPVAFLINNAAVTVPDLRRTAEGVELHLATNHLGPYALTNLLLEQVTGRVVTVASIAEQRAGRIDLDDPGNERQPYRAPAAYGRSKLANLLFTAELQRRLDRAGSPVRAQAAHPGLVATEMYRDSGRLTKILVRLLAQGPAAGALPTLYAAVADLPGNSYAGPGRFGTRGAPKLIDRSAAAADPVLAARLWSVSERLTGIGFPRSLVGAAETTDP